MKRVYDARKLYGIAVAHSPMSRNMQRNAIPYVFKKGEEYWVVQPGGFCHVTNKHLHEFDGKWNNQEFERGNYKSVLRVADTTGAAVTGPDKVRAALKQHPDAEPIGWCPSISIIGAYILPEKMHGASIRHSWGDLKIAPGCDIFVVVRGNLHGANLTRLCDGYLEERASFELWHQLGNRAFKGELLLENIPELAQAELKRAQVTGAETAPGR